MTWLHGSVTDASESSIVCCCAFADTRFSRLFQACTIVKSLTEKVARAHWLFALKAAMIPDNGTITCHKNSMNEA